MTGTPWPVLPATRAVIICFTGECFWMMLTSPPRQEQD